MIETCPVHSRGGSFIIYRSLQSSPTGGVNSTTFVYAKLRNPGTVDRGLPVKWRQRPPSPPWTRFGKPLATSQPRGGVLSSWLRGPLWLVSFQMRSDPHFHRCPPHRFPVPAHSPLTTPSARGQQMLHKFPEIRVTLSTKTQKTCAQKMGLPPSEQILHFWVHRNPQAFQTGVG